ncbi:YdeI/OmpD-associated family protein [Streptococcus gallolyticus]|nr:YdeI/OmpD-associated family protein [Streptococcus gallolyticus]MBY5040494.1 YdeI/OmpD-associated family protein [Streptococcus gallolyticus]
MIIDFKEVSTAGLESSPVAEALAGMRANEARYFWNKYKVVFETFPIAEKADLMADINVLLKEERDLVFAAKPLEISQLFLEDHILWTHVFYEDGLIINILYDMEDRKKQAVGLKLSEGMEVPTELVDQFKFARQKSKLAGTIRGSYFTLKKDHAVLTNAWLEKLTASADTDLDKKLGLHKFDKKAVLTASKEASPFDGWTDFSSSDLAQADLLVAYVYDLVQMKSVIDHVLAAQSLTDNGQLFLIYPKQKNPLGHQAIGRDSIFPYLGINKEHFIENTSLKFNRMLAIDVNYTMISVKNLVNPKKSSAASQKVADYAERIDDIRQLLLADEAALTFYNSLTPGYQKDWARYVFSAKQEATQAKRKAEMLDILNKGFKTRQLYQTSLKK